MLENANLDDVTVHTVKSTITGLDITVANCVAGVDLEKPSMKQLRSLCSKWKLKKYRSAKKQEILELIATHQKMRRFYMDKQKKQRVSKEGIQGSKMRLLNVVFSEDFFNSIMTMNDRKLRPELDSGGAGNNKSRWAEVAEAYNDSVNDDEYGSYAFIEDEHVERFVGLYDLCKFRQLDWQRACDWFKEMVKDYSKALAKFTLSGTHQPDFMQFVDKKPQIYYYRLYMDAKPGCHKAFNVILDDSLFSESVDGGTRNEKDRKNKVVPVADRKAEIMKEVAASMTAAFTSTQARTAKRTEKNRLEQNIGTVMMNLLTVPDDQKGDRARTFFNKQISENEERVEELNEWFADNPSP
jgi:hypothetical protein